jgi:hypothetical protein
MQLLEHIGFAAAAVSNAAQKRNAPADRSVSSLEDAGVYGVSIWLECSPFGTDVMHAGNAETEKGEF